MILRAGRVVDPTLGLDACIDLRIRGELVTELGEHLEPSEGEEIVDATNAIVAPGFIDMHAHLRDPGNTEKETLQSGSAAAAAGGFTAVACMPNTQPPLDTAQRVAGIVGRAQRMSGVRIYPIAAITHGRLGNVPVDFQALERAGAVAFSDDGETVRDEHVMREAARHARGVRGRIIAHCEDPRRKGKGQMHDGAVSKRLGIPGSPAEAEASIVTRDLRLAEQTGKAWHIAHVSTIGAVDALRAAREKGVPVSGEATPHHLVFTDEAIARLGAAAKVNPPLRPYEHVRALREAVRDGTIEALASDHAPHERAAKQGELDGAAVGFSGLEVAVGAYALALPDLPLSRFVALLSSNPARLLNVSGGTLRPGSIADVTIFADRLWRVDTDRFHSKGRVTPFAGMVLPRRPVATIVAGRLVMHEGRLPQQRAAS